MLRTIALMLILETVKANVKLKAAIGAQQHHPADLEAAGISVQEIEEELSGSDSISLVTACAIADELGESLDSLLGHTPKEMIKAALQQEDGQTAEIIELLLDLPADRQQEALSYLRYLSGRAEK